MTTIGLRLSRDDLKGKDGVRPELILLFNPYEGEVEFILPERENGGEWIVEIDTAERSTASAPGGQPIHMEGRSLILLH